MRFHKERRARRPVVAGLLLTSLATSPFVSAECTPYPIAVPVGNVTLSNGYTARGVELAVGHPLQSLAFLPQWPLNNTFIYGTNGYCVNGLSGTGCTTWRGGQYALLNSDTRRQPPDNPNPTDASPYPKTTTYTDVFQLNENVTLDEFAIGVALSDWLEQGYHPMMALGLGSNSTILSALKAGNQIASRVWSMFYGLTGGNENAQLDGVLVLGGYDQAKVSGRGYTLDLQPDPRCGTQMLVTIGDMILHFPNGTDHSIVAPGGGGFTACITPDFPGLMTLAYDPYFQEFQTATNASITDRSLGQEWYTMLYSDGDDPFLGDMSINIQYGPSIRIPNSELVIPERTVDSSTGMLVANYSRSNLVINSLQDVNENDLSQLGRMFLSSAYVMANQDSGKFTIWAANPTTVESLVGVDGSGKDVTTFCSNSTAPESTATTPTAPGPSGNANSPKLSSGAIAGIVVGAVAAVAIVTGALLWRRRRGKVSTTVEVGPPYAPQGAPLQPDFYPYYPTSVQDPSKREPSMLPGGESTPDPAELTNETSELRRPSTMGAPRFELGG
ncbi:aspartic peptidase domain-containing protein [Xylaria acuta]|nr:aspartic peptidase domain-containing protein [Xylaria acuta]